MKFIILILCCLVAVIAQPPLQCMPFPSKKPPDCCAGLEKFTKGVNFGSCYMPCGRDRCCAAKCFGKAFGFMKDDIFDKETTVSALKKVFAGDEVWISSALKAVNDCAANSGDPNSSCSADSGLMVLCIKKKLYYDCPYPVKDEECEKTKKFIDCMDKNK